MKILFNITPNSIQETYGRVKAILRGNDDVIFKSMELVSTSMNSKFKPPSSPVEYELKHNEIVRMFNYRNAIKGYETALRLMSEIVNEVNSRGGIPGVDLNNLLSAMTFSTNLPKVKIIITPERHYAVEWSVPFNYKGQSDEGSIRLELYNEDWREIVPAYLVQYVHSAIISYQQGMNAVAVALISIAVEATLRDILVSKGYSFNPRANPYDVYDFEEAAISVDGNSYKLDFKNTPPKTPSEFLGTTGGQPSVDIRIKREFDKGKNRFNLTVKVPDYLVDHLSCANIVQRAQKRVNSLEEALNIARNVEGFLTPDILPVDVDAVIKVVRNKLIHLSGEALETALDSYDSSGNFKLKDFIDSSVYVYDLISNIPYFINKQYLSIC